MNWCMVCWFLGLSVHWLIGVMGRGCGMVPASPKKDDGVFEVRRSWTPFSTWFQTRVPGHEPVSVQECIGAFF